MIIALLIAVCTSLICFVIGSLRRVRQYSSLPLHLRWELYPVPHESKERAAYGGSYFEVSDWWTKPRKKNRIGELRVMADEIFAFNSVRSSNPNLWWRTLSFHGGMYLVIAFLLLEVAFWAIPRWTFADAYIVNLGRSGVALIVVGSLALLWRRVTVRKLWDYTHLADYIHLAAIALTGSLIFTGSLSPSAPSVQQLARALITLDTQVQVPALLASGLLLAFLVLAYVPYSHMAHFIAKYFTYHAIRWDDEPNVSDKFRSRMAQSLSYKPTWWAAHIGADGTKTWAEISTHNPAATKEVRS